MIQIYGLMIFLALIIYILLLYYDKRRQQILADIDLFNIVGDSVIVGIIGGRILYVLIEYQQYNSLLEALSIFKGGFSVLGTIISVVCFLIYKSIKLRLNILALTDIAATYAPIMQSISRLGCFFAGCCYGITSNNLFIKLYFDGVFPAQLFSSFIHLINFFILQKTSQGLGNRTAVFLILTCLERFIVDFFRGDRHISFMIDNIGISIYQIIALIICVLVLFFKLIFKKRAYLLQ